MTKFIIALILATVSLQVAYSANATAGTGFATCGGTSINTTNCAFCDQTGTSTYCTACNAGYQLANTAANGPTLCQLPCAAGCLWCKGTAGAASVTAAQTSGNANSKLCQLDNSNPAGTTAQTAAYCKPIAATTTALAVYYTPGAVTAADNTYNCWACAVAGCTSCTPGNGTQATADTTQCRQCANGYFLDSNTTVQTTGTTATNVTVGTACTACGTISPVSGTTSNSAFVVAGTCNQCVNKTGCVNATCTRYQGTTAGTGSADTTSYVFDISKQACVPKSGSRLTIAVVAAVALTFVALF